MSDENVNHTPDENVNHMSDEQLNNNDAKAEAAIPSAGVDMVSVTFLRNHAGFSGGLVAAVPRLVAVELEKYGIAEVHGDAPKMKVPEVVDAPNDNS